MQAEKRSGVPARPVLALGEHDRFVLVDECKCFQVPTHSAREQHLFQIAALAQHVFHRVAVPASNGFYRKDPLPHIRSPGILV